MNYVLEKGKVSVVGNSWIIWFRSVTRCIPPIPPPCSIYLLQGLDYLIYKVIHHPTPRPDFVDLQLFLVHLHIYPNGLNRFFSSCTGLKLKAIFYKELCSYRVRYKP